MPSLAISGIKLSYTPVCSATIIVTLLLELCHCPHQLGLHNTSLMPLGLKICHMSHRIQTEESLLLQGKGDAGKTKNHPDNKGGVQKKTKKKVVILLQPPSIYLPTPIGVQKATFLIFLGCFEMMFKPLLEIENFFRIIFSFTLVFFWKVNC